MPEPGADHRAKKQTAQQAERGGRTGQQHEDEAEAERPQQAQGEPRPRPPEGDGREPPGLAAGTPAQESGRKTDPNARAQTGAQGPESGGERGGCRKQALVEAPVHGLAPALIAARRGPSHSTWCWYWV
ncbi:hypothetical protein OG311_01225 [Streptomyces sp. NBC_01343]|uniref:hypothetical protein n=1 Tax=Streptomyces sp. NBC_01343 TaxID=2903832 RepID=UPI002E15B083|nr:hypothetical protein OG311_01225 [Streptomyces sp. NBC_01343]